MQDALRQLTKLQASYRARLTLHDCDCVSPWLRSQSADVAMLYAGFWHRDSGEHDVAEGARQITTLAEFLNSVRSRTWSLAINFNDAAGQQVSKSLFRCNQASCIHGLWFGLAHPPTTPTASDFDYLSSTGVGIEVFGETLLSLCMTRSWYSNSCVTALNSTRQHTAKLSSGRHWSSRNQSDRMVTYLRSRYLMTVYPDDEAEGLPIFAYVVNERGLGQNRSFTQWTSAKPSSSFGDDEIRWHLFKPCRPTTTSLP